MHTTIKARRLAAITLSAATAAALLGGSAVATTPGGTTDVAFILVNHRVLNNAYVVGHGSTSPVVIGGSTTVPTNATTVRLSVSVKGSAAGSLYIYPAGHPDGASGDTVDWTVTKIGSGIVSENVGTSNEITFVNNTSRPINLTATIIGYSTQVTAGDVSGQGGTAGQVLTTNGTRASWQTPGTLYADHASRTTLGASASGDVLALEGLPAGNYLAQVSGTVDAINGQNATAECQLTSGATVINTARSSVAGSVTDAYIGMQAVITIPDDGFVGVQCWSFPNPTWLIGHALTLTAIGTVHQTS